jgi:FkbM family methyltransferase
MLPKPFWTLVSLLTRNRRFRTRLASFILQAQARLGIGSGGHVGASGEDVALQILAVTSSATPGRELCVFDVGANQGQYLETAIHSFPDRPRSIHAFEPSAATFRILAQRFGHVTGVRLNPVGLGDRAGEYDLFSDAEGSGLASLTERQLEHLGISHQRSERVRIETLHEYCAAQGIERIDLLKIDVEGHELDVLRGADGMLSRRRIRMVTFEFGGCNIDTKTFVREFWQLFTRHGMTSFHRIMPSGRLFRIDRYTESLELFLTTNFLVVLDPDLETTPFE